MGNDERLYKRIVCSFCTGQHRLYPYNVCPYCDKTGTEYVEASIKSIAEYCNQHLTVEELNKLKNLINS